MNLYFAHFHTGEIWPKPFQQTSVYDFFIVRPSLLKFEVKLHAILRLKSINRAQNF